MNITKYNAILSVVFVAAVVVVAFFSTIANVLANEDHEHKKYINVQKEVCINKNINIGGNEVFSSDNTNFPHCFNLNINSQTPSD